MAKILIIDDEPLVLAYLRKRLESNRHEVSELASGVDASRIQRERSFELVITDIFMPDEDGLQTITRLRGEDPDLPIIAMSGGAHRHRWIDSREHAPDGEDTRREISAREAVWHQPAARSCV